MSILTATNLSKSFGIQDVFWGVNVSVAHGERIALVGPNGTGKTTLLRILVGLEAPGEGTVTHMNNARIGYLPQDAIQTGDEDAGDADAADGGDAAGDERTPWNLCLDVFADLQAMQTRLRQLEALLADPEQGEAAMERYGRLFEQFEHAGGYEYTIEIDTVLSGLGIDQAHRRRPLGQLSGGQRTRAALARLLLEKPHLLVLDEPTNHLDMQAIEWLESYLQGWPGALLAVSHDRYFMDHVAQKIWDLRFGTIEVYHGNYTHYVEQREERITRQLKEWKQQQRFIDKEESYISRYMAGQRTGQAQGRLKRLDRLERIERPEQEKSIRVALGSDQRSGDLILRTRDLVIGYDRPLARVEDMELRRLHRAALIGPNGAGKTTFLKTLLGQIPPLEGEARLGASLEIGYMSQTQEELDEANTVIDEVGRAKALLPGEMRNFLARFLFTDDDVFKRIGDLSGGERCRVVLAKLTLAGTNFLVLDEPTNQLDIPSQEILEDVFREFIGTILLVSHDRYLIDRLATQIWIIEGGHLRVYECPYQEYLQRRQRQEAAARERAKAQQENERQRRLQQSPPRAKEQGGPSRTIDEVESEIHALESELETLNQALVEASSEQQLDRVRKLGVQYDQVQNTLEERMAEWVALGEAGG